jgi:hypothetical protein
MRHGAALPVCRVVRGHVQLAGSAMDRGSTWRTELGGFAIRLGRSWRPCMGEFVISVLSWLVVSVIIVGGVAFLVVNALKCRRSSRKVWS